MLSQEQIDELKSNGITALPVLFRREGGGFALQFLDIDDVLSHYPQCVECDLWYDRSAAGDSAALYFVNKKGTVSNRCWLCACGLDETRAHIATSTMEEMDRRSQLARITPNKGEDNG